ncbi:MAG: sensor histidine kinase [Actinobacteria bacterium]|nr:sensor histidine kinase [Actinomycetota bacterium]
MIPTSWRAYRPPPVDVALAAGFVALGQLVTWGRFDESAAFAGPRPANAVLNLLLMVTLAWRRRAPLAALAAAVSVYFLPHAVVQHDMPLLAVFVPLIVLTASAGYHCPPRRALLAGVLAWSALVTVTLVSPWLRSVDGLLFNSSVLLVPWFAARGLRAREDRAGALHAALAGERVAKEAALREVAASERTRIARELHDIVAHSVSMMIIQVGAARMQLPPDAHASQAPLLAAEDVGRQAIADLRRLLGVLRDDGAVSDGAKGEPQPPVPGLSQLDALVRRTRGAGLEVSLEVEGRPVVLPAGLDLTAYRIVQEALTNSLKHSGGSRVEVRIRYAPTSVVVDVADDGVATGTGVAAGHGLVGIQERVAVFGGAASAGPDPAGGGWRVHAELPLEAAPDRRSGALPAP